MPKLRVDRRRLVGPRGRRVADPFDDRRERRRGVEARVAGKARVELAAVVERVRDTSPARADEAASIDAQLRRRLREPDLVRTVARVVSLLREEAS